MLIVAGTIRMKNPTELDAFMQDVRATSPAVHASEGNLSFACTVDDPAEGTALMFERWQDQEGLDTYLARPEVVAVFDKWGDRTVNSVKQYDASNERSRA